MLYYDLTETTIFEAQSSKDFPTEAELFVLTVALLLSRGVSYGDLEKYDIQFRSEETGIIAGCIQLRLTPLVRDFGDSVHLRDRLNRLAGLVIGSKSLRLSGPNDAHFPLHESPGDAGPFAKGGLG